MNLSKSFSNLYVLLNSYLLGTFITLFALTDILKIFKRVLLVLLKHFCPLIINSSIFTLGLIIGLKPFQNKIVLGNS